MFPVFALVLDKDVPAEIALLYPELYKELAKGRSVSLKTFCLWVFISIYQGSVIMYGSLFLFDADFIHIVSITFTSMVLTELLMVALTVCSYTLEKISILAFRILNFIYRYEEKFTNESVDSSKF